MDLKSFRQLITPAGSELLNLISQIKPKEEDYLLHFQRLSRQFSADLVHAALETVILRQRARAKFPFADQLYFSREALEQASAWEIATYRAARYAEFERALDLGCSIGGDCLALSQVLPTVGIDRDFLRIAMAQMNARALNLEENCQVIQADLRVSIPIYSSRRRLALFFDPARRVAGNRLHHVDQYQPPLNSIYIWQKRFANLGIKISPAVKLDEVSEYDCEVEFISLRGELKEAVLWFGEMRQTKYRATILPGAFNLSSADKNDIEGEKRALSPPRQYLYEPDPAILRAGLVQKLAILLDAYQLDPDIAFLTSDQSTPTPFARIWRIEDWMPFNVKTLREYFRNRRVGKITVKKRGSPIEPAELKQLLKLKGENERLIFLTHYAGKPIVIVAYGEKG